MKKIQCMAFAAAVVLLTSCNNEQGFEPSDRVAAKFTEAAITRATATTWDTGDKIGVYMVAGEATLTDAAAIDGAVNISYTISNPSTGTFATTTPTEQIYFPADGPGVDFHAYYPYQAAMTDGIYKVDVSDQSNHPAIDLLTATAANKTKASPNVAFQFSHRLSKLSITLAPGDGFTAADLTGVTVKITGLPATADYNIGTGAFTPAATSTDITPKMSGTAGLTATAIVIPQAIVAANSVQVVFSLSSGKEFYWNLTASALESGSNYIYSLKLNRTGVSVTSSNITGWTPNAPQSGSADEIVYYKVGDYYPDAVHPIGVVFYLDNPDATGKGEHGKVVNLKESLSILAWGSYATTAASDMDNGLFNMQTIKGLSSDFSDYPAFAYVNGLNHNPTGTSYADGSKGVWYLPAKNELKQLYAAMSGLRWIASGTAGEGEITDWEDGSAMPGYAASSTVRSDFNRKFTADGVDGKEIDSYYWSSTERDDDNAWYVGFGLGCASYYYKNGNYYVRSCLAF